jgi:hypothetical protein
MQQRRRAQDQQARCDVSELKRCDRQERADDPRLVESTQLESGRPAGGTGCPVSTRFRGGDGDRDRREGAGDCREVEGVPDPERGHETGREQGADDSAEVIAGAFESEGAAVRLRRRQRGEHRISCRRADAARKPCGGAGEPRLPHRRGQTDRPGRRGGDDVTTRGHA